MSKEKTPYDDLITQYKREYKRISQALRRQSKLGYHIPPDLHPIRPSQVAMVTQSDIDELIALTPEKIRKNSYYTDPETGEALYGFDIVQSHREAKASKAKVKQFKARPKGKQAPTKRKRKTKKSERHPDKIPPKEVSLNAQIIADFTAKLEALEPWGTFGNFKQHKLQTKGTLISLWEGVLAAEGEYAVAYRLQGKATELNVTLDTLWYASKSDIENFNFSALVTLIKGSALTQQESDYYGSQGQAYATNWEANVHDN